MYRVIFTPPARAELIDAQDWYENEVPGLGRRKIVISQVPKCEAPGAPTDCGGTYIAPQHPGHPPPSFSGGTDCSPHPGHPPANDRSFTGQDQNVQTGSAGSGVYDFLFRKYDPSAGRWLSPDPLGWGAVNQADPQSFNRYAYVENQPMNATDPNGLLLCIANHVSSDGKLYGYDSGDAPCRDGYWSYNVLQSVTVSANGDSCSDSNPAACVTIQNPTIGATVYPTTDPNNQRSGYESLFCLGDALKSNGVSLGLDAAGIGVALLSGGSTNLGVFKFFGTLGVGAASTGYRVGTSSSFSGGAANFARGTTGTLALGIAVLQEADSSVKPLQIIPYIGNLSLALDTTEDLVKTYQAQSSCVDTGKYD